MTIKIALGWAAAGAIASFVACGGSSSAPDSGGVPDSGGMKDAGPDAGPDAGSDAGPDGGTPDSGGMPDAGGKPDGGNDADAGSYLNGLPGWPAPPADSDMPIDGGMAVLPGGDAGFTDSCTSTEYSLTKTPNDIVTLNPNAELLWPGGLLQGAPLKLGQLAGVPLTQRAPLQVSIPTLLSANNTLTVPNPTLATVQDAIGELVNEAINEGVQASSSISYTSTAAYSADQAALDLGVNASLFGFDLGAMLGVSQSSTLSTVVGYFVQSMFTVTVPEPEQASDFFSGLTEAELNAVIAEGDIGPNNLPVYVASVTYGRIMMFSITSATSATNIQAALSAEYQGGVGGGGVSASYSQLMSDSSTTFSVVTVGGAAADAEALIQSGDPADFFSSDPPISTGVPISYTLRNLSNNSIATVTSTTDYSVQTCVSIASGPGANYYITDTNGENENQGVLRTYDSQGNAVSLTVSPPTGLFEPAGVIYDSLYDRIYFTDGCTVEAIKPDGTSIATSGGFPGVTCDNAPVTGMTYDVIHDRIFAENNGPFFIAAYNRDGDPLDTYYPSPIAPDKFPPTLVSPLFVPSTGLVLVTIQQPIGVIAYQLDGTQVAVTGSGADAMNLGTPGSMAYDAIHDRIYLAQPSAVEVLDHDFNLLSTLSIPGISINALSYDPLDDQIAIATGQGTIKIIKPDGSAVNLPPGAFANLVNPNGIAYRP